MNRRVLLSLTAATVFAITGALVSSLGPAGSVVKADAQPKCTGLPNAAALKGFLAAAP